VPELIASNDKNDDDASARARKFNERFNVPEQTEEEEADSHGKNVAESLADDKEIKRRKQH
jgi:hypothetical protein